MASVNYGLDVDVNGGTEGEVDNRINLSSFVSKENIRLPPKAEDERLHSPSLQRISLEKSKSIDNGDDDNLHEYVDIELKKDSPFYSPDNSNKISDEVNPYYSMPENKNKIAVVGKPLNIVINPEGHDDKIVLNQDTGVANRDTSMRTNVDIKLNGEDDLSANKNNEHASDDVNGDLVDDDANLSSYNNLTLEINEPDDSNKVSEKHAYVAFPYSTSVASRKRRNSDTSLSSIQRDYEMVNTVDYLNDLPSNNNNNNTNFRYNNKSERRDTKQSFDEVDLGSHIQPHNVQKKTKMTNKKMGKLKGRILQGFAYVIRVMGVFFLVNMILALIIPVLIFSWEEESKNDVYTDSRIEAMMGISIYVCVGIFVQIIVGLIATQKSRFHLMLFIHTFIMAILMFAASICVAVVAQDVRDDGNCDTNDCDSLITVSVLGFILVFFLIILSIFYWFDLRVFGYRCECCFEINRDEEN